MPNNKNYHNAIQSERSGVHYRISSGLEFTWQHFSLIERFLSRNDLTPFDKVFNVVSPCVARSQRTTTFEAYKGDELLGFSIVRETLKNVAIATWAAYKNNPLQPLLQEMNES